MPILEINGLKYKADTAEVECTVDPYRFIRGDLGECPKPMPTSITIIGQSVPKRLNRNLPNIIRVTLNDIVTRFICEYDSINIPDERHVEMIFRITSWSASSLHGECRVVQPIPRIGADWGSMELRMFHAVTPGEFAATYPESWRRRYNTLGTVTGRYSGLVPHTGPKFRRFIGELTADGLLITGSEVVTSKPKLPTHSRQLHTYSRQHCYERQE